MEMATKRVDEGQAWFERVTEEWAATGGRVAVARRRSLRPAAAGEALSLEDAVAYALASG